MTFLFAKQIEKIIVLGMEEAPSPCVSFQELIVGDDGSLYDQDRSCDPHNDVVVMPFSSGTTGPPKVRVDIAIATDS